MMIRSAAALINQYREKSAGRKNKEAETVSIRCFAEERVTEVVSG